MSIIKSDPMLFLHMEHLIEHGGADWIARSIYKAPTLEQWNYYSKIVVPRASYTLKLAGRALGAAGLGVFIYETYTCTRKCMKCL
jgi:hypothetical protein